jgi:hypothetical protein
MDVEKMKGEIISAGEQAVKELIKVAKESIIKKAGDKETLSEKEEALAADRLKNAAATKKLAIFDAFEILNRIEQEKNMLEAIKENGGKAISTKGTGFAESKSR